LIFVTDRRRYPVGVEPAFCYAVELTLGEEGLFSDYTWDPGGKTKYGITEATARRHGFEVREITVPGAIEIYWREYWIQPGLDALSSWHVAAECFDTQVNTGRGALIAQRALVNNLLATESEVGGIDGRWGRKTRAALNMATRRYERQLLGALNGEQYRHYHSIRPHRPDTFENAIRGWMKRVWTELPVINVAAWMEAAETGVKP
jgi:lysozyme family protein